MLSFLLTFAFILIHFLGVWGSEPLPENERVAQWHKRYNEWPIKWQALSEGMQAVIRTRESEIMQLTGSNERWENFMQLTQSLMVPRLTAKGFIVYKLPPEMQHSLQNILHTALNNPRGGLAAYEPPDYRHYLGYYGPAPLVDAEAAAVHALFSPHTPEGAGNEAAGNEAAGGASGGGGGEALLRDMAERWLSGSSVSISTSNDPSYRVRLVLDHMSGLRVHRKGASMAMQYKQV
jgi:hypothetical protein